MDWPSVVVLLQIVSGLLWLMLAVYLTPRVIRSWRPDPSRVTVHSAPVAFVGWMMAGFSVRWMAWPHTIDRMGAMELLTWTALYVLSSLLAVWFFVGARQTRSA